MLTTKIALPRMTRSLFPILLLSLFLASCQQTEQEALSAAPAKDTLSAAPAKDTANSVAQVAQQENVDRPNILLVVVDDLAFSDLSIFGSEINTPNIDALARDGVLLTNFHVAPNCSPTRAMLLSGTDSHIAGLGNMDGEIAPNQEGRPGYEGHLNFRVAALSELLQDAGYHTYMTGKWHLGLTQETSPAARGFDKSFALLQGGAGAFANRLALFGPDKAKYMEDGQALTSLPEDFYSTRFYTDKMIDYIDSNRADGKAFFAYLAYTSPHWPLQAPAASIDKQKGKYDEGYDVLKARRLQQSKALGFVDAEVEPYPRLAGELAWDELDQEQQLYESRKMEIYAAMVDDVDIYLGKLIAYLKEIGEYDNTFIFFMSDNGPEAHDLTDDWEGLAEFVASCCDNSYENMGKPDSYIWYGPGWGQAGNTPRRMFKGFPSQGGINVPAVFHFPKSIPGGVRRDDFLHVTDVMPTLLEVAGVAQAGASYRGRQVKAISGKSVLPMLSGKSETVHAADHVTGWELFGKRAIRQGDWKLLWEPLPYGTGDWQLYHLVNDPTETNDLSAQRPQKLTQMKTLWDDYAKKNGVIIPNKVSGY